MRFFAIVLLLAGCGEAPPPEPRASLRRYLAALDHDDPHAAFQLLAKPVRAKLPEAQFIAEWRSTAPERRAQAEALRVALTRGDDARAWALVAFRDGTRMPLVRDGDGWRLQAASPEEAHAETPVEALRRFAQALEARRYDEVLALLGDPLRSEVERQIKDRLDRLKAALARTPSGEDIEVTGDRARFQYDARFRIDLERVAGEWRIRDLN